MTRTGVDVRGRKAGIGSHTQPQGGATVEWYTPPGLLTAIGLTYDLDPCTPAGGLPWIPAARTVSLPDDGLSSVWEGRVWLNPPYGPQTEHWLRRLAAHGDGIALVFARTETRWWHETVRAAHAVCFIAGRLTFVDRHLRSGEGNAGGPSALIAYGQECAEAIAAADLGMTFAINATGLRGQACLWETSS